MSSLITEAIVRASRGTAAAWTSADTVLEAGEWGYETDTGKAKIGDGSTAWTSLGYAAETGIVATVAAKITGSTDQICKAWINFDGTGTVSINDSYNVSSLSDDGVGLYTINFTSAMGNANYAYSGLKEDAASALDGHINVVSPLLTTAFTVQCIENNAAADSPVVLLNVFGS